MKSGENWSSHFREEDVKRLHDSITVYSPGARADNLCGGFKLLILTKKFYYFNHSKF